MSFNRDTGYYVINICFGSRRSHFNEPLILTHARIGSDLTEDEKNQLDVFVKIGSTA